MADDIQTIALSDEHYPSLLREIYDPPQELYVRGNAALLNDPQLLAVVGSRRATYYGKQAVEHLLSPVVHAGIIIVSGMAYGIDSFGHRICIENKRPTIAVLGAGLDDASMYPQGNRLLARAILEHGGALISEYPLGTKALLHHFPARNRIIAGLSKATLVVQAAKRSGSLITARLALEANREVCAVPGSITDPLSAGTNDLIRQGAAVITKPEDILQLYGIIHETPQQELQQLTPEQMEIFTHLSSEPKHADHIITASNMPPQKVTAALLTMELTGHVKHAGGMRYVRNV